MLLNLRRGPLFTGELPRLGEQDKRLIMGEALRAQWSQNRSSLAGAPALTAERCGGARYPSARTL
jgi:hypothetical protein